MDITYHNLCINYKHIEQIRLDIVKYAIENGKKAAALHYKTTIKTVRKWVKRYELSKSRIALTNLSRARKTQNMQITAKYMEQIIAYAQKAVTNNKRLKASYCKKELNCPYSLKTVLKVLHTEGFLKKKRHKKHDRKKDLRAIKSNFKAFEKIQIDIKYLDDISEFYKDYKQYNFPRYQLTARDVKTGALFIGYAIEKSRTNTVLFLHTLIEHLKNHNVDLKNITIQTDNGTEFITGFNSKKDSVFTQYINTVCKKHTLIPPGACTYNSDVETSHRWIEEEFYSQKYFTSKDDILNQAFDYVKSFNFKRYNTYKGGTPYDILHTDNIDNILNDNVLIFKPVILDYQIHNLTFIQNNFRFITS